MTNNYIICMKSLKSMINLIINGFTSSFQIYCWIVMTDDYRSCVDDIEYYK